PLNLATALGGAELFLLDRYVAAPVVAVGYIGLIGVVVDRLSKFGVVANAFSALGRTAMSGYIAQNVVCALLCYGFGLGLAAQLGREPPPVPGAPQGAHHVPGEVAAHGGAAPGGEGVRHHPEVGPAVHDGPDPAEPAPRPH